MHIDEFIDKLAKVASKKQWRLTTASRRKMIRCGPMNSQEECPITALRNQSANDVHEVARELGLSPSDAVNIIMAADDDMLNPLRQKLLKATGLAE